MKTYFHQVLPFAAIFSFAAFCLLSIHQPIEYFEVTGSLPADYSPFSDWQIVAASQSIGKVIKRQEVDTPDDRGRFTVSVYAPIDGPAYLFVWKDGFARQRYELNIEDAQDRRLDLPPLFFTSEKIKDIPSRRSVNPTSTFTNEAAKPRTIVIYDQNMEEIDRIPADQLSFFHLQPHPETSDGLYFGHLGIYDSQERESIKSNKFFRFSRIGSSGLKYTEERH